ncbi:MAG: GGDEF domain-containing protein [Lachnospiraceae bacterium]|nr:GGDEF domain-containing protein [Lachnospiraceae bacterium]
MQENSTKDRKRISIGRRVYCFIAVVVFVATFGASMIAYKVHIGQIDTYYKNLSLNTAINFASFVDGDYLNSLCKAISTEEYNNLRDTAEETDNEDMIRDYLIAQGLWDQYDSTRSFLIQYLRNMKDIKYLYIMRLGESISDEDIYLIDDDDNPLYITGTKEADNLGLDGPTGIVPPSISNTDWGWLCSAYAPVYDSKGSLVCHVGCDISMDEVMASRTKALLLDVLGSAVFTLLVTLIAIHYTKHTVIKPLNKITAGLGHFSPSPDVDYEKAGVIDINLRNNDEISDIYHAIQSNQKRIVDYIKDIVVIQKEKEIAENETKLKEKEIGEISKDAYLDALTHVGSKIAYSKKIAEMNENINPGAAFAVIMVDVNFLKTINDNHGHAAGDTYLSGCCNIVCDIFKHSPVYRVGGDEFLVILTGSDYRNRHERIRQLQDAFDKSYNQTDVDPWLRYSAAFGMAEFSSDDDNVESVCDRADKEMYREKARFKQSLGIDPETR